MPEEGGHAESAPRSGFFPFIEIMIKTILMPPDQVPLLRPPAPDHFDQGVLLFEIDRFTAAVTGESRGDLRRYSLSVSIHDVSPNVVGDDHSSTREARACETSTVCIMGLAINSESLRGWVRSMMPTAWGVPSPVSISLRAEGMDTRV